MDARTGGAGWGSVSKKETDRPKTVENCVETGKSIECKLLFTCKYKFT